MICVDAASRLTPHRGGKSLRVISHKGESGALAAPLKQERRAMIPANVANALSGPSRLTGADRAISQLLAGTPSGPGGSSAAARVPCCDKARGRRTSSRFTTPHDRAPQWTRCAHDTRGSERGDYAGITRPLSSSRRKPGSRATGIEQATLDTGLRRYDGACCKRGRATDTARRRRGRGDAPTRPAPAPACRRP